MGMYPGLLAIFLLFQCVDYSNSQGHVSGPYYRYAKNIEKVETRRNLDLLQPEMEHHFRRDVFITVRLYDSDCFSSASESPYVIYLGALNFDSKLIHWHRVESWIGVTVDEGGMKEINVVYKEEEMDDYPETCFAQGGEPCVPRADVIYIEYINDPEDTWSLSRIEVEVQFRLWPGMENWYLFKYEHLILWPCDSWLDSKAFYQIGPRPGFFEKLETAPSKLELPAWLAVVVIVVSVPALAFTAYKLFALLSASIEEKRRRKSIREDVETVKAPRRPSQHTVSISTVDGKDRFDMSRRPTIPGQPPKPPMTNKVSSISLPGTKQASTEAEPAPKISGCCIDEERLLGLGKMPFDISIVEEERQKELEKLQRAPESPPVAKILNSHPNHPNTPSPAVTPTPQPSRQST